jgi:hypothetical protein
MEAPMINDRPKTKAPRGEQKSGADLSFRLSGAVHSDAGKVEVMPKVKQKAESVVIKR